MLAAIRVFALVLLVAACATGVKPSASGDDDGGDDDVSVDAPSSTADARQVVIDAPGTADAPVSMPDAFIPIDAPQPDAASPFCAANSECTQPGQCCIRLGGPLGFCGDGIPIGNECFPQ